MIKNFFNVFGYDFLFNLLFFFYIVVKLDRKFSWIKVIYYDILYIRKIYFINCFNFFYVNKFFIIDYFLGVKEFINVILIVLYKKLL